MRKERFRSLAFDKSVRRFAELQATIGRYLTGELSDEQVADMFRGVDRFTPTPRRPVPQTPIDPLIPDPQAAPVPDATLNPLLDRLKVVLDKRDEFSNLAAAVDDAIERRQVTDTERLVPDVLVQARDRANIHVLVGHDFDKPLGDLASGTARLESNRDGVAFEVDLPDPDQQPSWMRDAVQAVRGGLMRGVSPGFRIPPRAVSPGAERLVPEPGNSSVMIRDIHDAILTELSLVTRPAYSGTDVELRSEANPSAGGSAREVLTWL